MTTDRSTMGFALPAYVGLVLAFLALPILVVIASAFTSGNELTFPPRDFSFRWFSELISDPDMPAAFGTSALVAATATGLSLVVGTCAAIGLVRGELPGRIVLELLFIGPIMVPSIILASALVMIFIPIELIRTLPGLVLAHTILTMPYVVRVVSGTLEAIPIDYEDVAASLGASGVRTFINVLLPLLAPGILGATIFSLIMSFDEFTISLFLSGPGLKTLPVAIYDHADANIDPLVAAIGALMIGITTVLVVGLERSLGLRRAFRV